MKEVQQKRLERQRERAQQKENKARREELAQTMAALQTNDAQFEQASEKSYIEQLTYQHAALMCRCRAIYRALRGEGEL